MPDILPIGYVTILQAVDILLPSMFAGVRDREIVKRVRQMEMDVSDGSARNEAIAEIWKAVDEGTVTAMAVKGQSQQIRKLTSAITKAIPALRSPAGRGFTLARPSNPAFQDLTDWFGLDISRITLIFEEAEIKKLGSRLRRTRRRKSSSDGQEQHGLYRQNTVQPIIREIVGSGKWNPLEHFPIRLTIS